MTNSTIMRAKQLPPSIGRPIHGVNTNYSGSVVYPQWMRALEEKYQRIHMKIARSTTAMTNLYNSSLGKNIQDKTVLKASLASPKDSIGSAPKSISPPRRVASSLDQRCISRARISATLISDLQTDPLEQQKYDCTSLVVSKFGDVDDISFTNSIEKDDNNGDNIQESDLQRPEEVSDTNSDSEIGEEVNSLDAEDGDTNDSVSTNKEEGKDQSPEKEIPLVNAKQPHKLSVQREGRRTTFVTSLGKHYHAERLARREKVARTCTSHRSIQTQKTTKSCPAVMDTTTGEHAKALGRYVGSRSRGQRKQNGSRHANMFSRMSMEAQHAMTETIQDVKPVDSYANDYKKPQVEEDAQVFCDKTNVNVKNENVAVVNKTKDSHRPKLRVKDDDYIYHSTINKNSRIEEDAAYSDSEISVPSRTRPITLLRKTKLPNIGDGNYISLQHLKTLKCRLPGIGKYDVAAPKREQTFEITPPGYDIRYTDMMVVEERESETPPPDIRNRAVQKCQDWLLKYTPR